MNFGQVLRNLRICSGMSLRELSRAIDVSPTYMSLIENGKQPPPSDSRVAQIEEALGLPSGYLLAATRTVPSDVALFISRMPEIADFLKAAKANSMNAEDFMILTSLINSVGWRKMRESLEEFVVRTPQAVVATRHEDALSPFVWPFLSEEMIFDITGVHEKGEFFKAVTLRMAGQLNGLQGEVLVKQLLARERLASTGIGEGVAVPHAYVSGLEHIVIVLCRVPAGLDFDAIDEEPVHLVLLLAGPILAKKLHRQLLARATRLLSYRSFRESVLGASCPHEVISIFRAAERNIP